MKSKIPVILFIVLDVFLFLWIILHGSNIALFNSKGVIAASERNLLITELSIMLIVGIPIIVFIFYTAWKYREGAFRQDYDPETKHKVVPEFLWWLIPAALVVVFALMTWQATHALDPFKPIKSNAKPITIQVVALRWKWLFIYPEQRIATVNFVEFPVNTPVDFELTADAPMNSFWIPQLSGQIYAMTGMSTKLHVLASETGDYPGSAAEISGAGFAGMRFVARSVSNEDFNAWAAQVKSSSKRLDSASYKELVKPSENNPADYYVLANGNLYNLIMEKYMSPSEKMNMKSMEKQ